MLKKAVALRHVPFEDLGLLAPVLAEAGWSVSYRDVANDRLHDPAIAAADLLIVLGGPIGAYEEVAYPFVTAEVSLLERRLAGERPTLGICLGSQLMARALGARVLPGGKKEIGWGRVEPSAAGLASCLAPLAAPDSVVLHWHGDTFDLPDGAMRLASNALYENQAFAYGPRALALQFHLEADPDRLEAWFVGHAAELASTGIAVPMLRAETAAVAGRLRPQADAVFRSWLSELGAQA